MSDAVLGLVGALVGGLAALGGAFVQARTAERSERQRSNVAAAESFRGLAQRYLFQLRDAVESLDARVHNWAERGGAPFAESRDPGYWQVTTLYAIGRALAAERILDLEGVYIQIEAAFKCRLERRQVEEAIRQATKNELFYYHRLAMAESILDRGPDGFRLLTYTEFRQRLADPAWELEIVLEPVTKALASLDDTKLRRLRADLASLNEQLDELMDAVQRSSDT
jgi:hypothetical protein